MRTLRFISVFFVYMIVVAIYYNQSYNALIQTTIKQTEQILINHEAIRKIINKNYIPELKRLKEENLLDKDYINPLFTSGTLLTKQLHEYTKPILMRKGIDVSIYKLASLNPLNKENKATVYEENIFKYLNVSKIENFSEIIEENDKSYLFYAEFFSKIKKRCLKCHSTPDIAPIHQVEQYGSTHGYNYKVGDQSALITLRSPLDKAVVQMQKEISFTALYIFLIFTFLYVVSEIVIYYLYKQNRKIVRNRKIRNQLIKDSQVDPLTNLLNRRTLEEIFNNEFNRAKRGNNILVFLLMDIDYFKNYNDRYGHLQGDIALKAVARILTRCFSRSHEHIFRYGGEEFAVVSSEYESKSNVLNWIKNLNNELANLNLEHKDSEHKYLTVSTGVYILTPNSTEITMEEVIKKADEALYKAKETGRNKAIIYE